MLLLLLTSQYARVYIHLFLPSLLPLFSIQAVPDPSVGKMYSMNGSGIIAVDLSFPDTVQFFAGRPSKKTDLPSTPLSFPTVTYPRRQKLRGKLRIVMSQAIKLNQVEVRFNGHTELAWRDPLKSEHSFLAERMNERKTLRKSKSTLLEEATLPAGVTELGKKRKKRGESCIP